MPVVLMIINAAIALGFCSASFYFFSSDSPTIFNGSIRSFGLDVWETRAAAGVMDSIADHHHIYKVKTIGDAYLAVAGLPGTESVSGNTTLSHCWAMAVAVADLCQGASAFRAYCRL